MGSSVASGAYPHQATTPGPFSVDQLIWDVCSNSDADQISGAWVLFQDAPAI
jgi:hypothetical protein